MHITMVNACQGCAISMERTMLGLLLLKPKVLYKAVKKEYLTKLSHAMKSAFVKTRKCV